MKRRKRQIGNMKIMLFFFTLAILAFSCKKNVGEPAPTVSDKCGGRYEKELFTSVKSTPDVLYGRSLNIASAQEALYMDVYEPGVDTARQRPVIIFVHGGAWTDGTKKQGQEFCTVFAKKGYVTISIDYRLGIEMPVNEKTRGEAIYRGVQDIKAAIRYVRANALLYKIDTTQVFIGGYSAGGTNAVHAAYWDENEVPQNIDRNRWGNLEGNGGNLNFSSEAQVLYGIACSIKEQTWMQTGEPPLVCVHSKTDNTVPYNSGLDGKNIFMYGGASLVQKAISLTIPASLYTYENIAHGAYLQAENSKTTFDAISGFLYSRVRCN